MLSIDNIYELMLSIDNDGKEGGENLLKENAKPSNDTKPK